MIMTGQNTLNTENMWTVEAQRVREEYIHPSTNHTRANVHIEEYKQTKQKTKIYYHFQHNYTFIPTSAKYTGHKAVNLFYILILLLATTSSPSCDIISSIKFSKLVSCP